MSRAAASTASERSIEELAAKLVEREAENEALRKRNAELKSELTKLKTEFTRFRHEVKRLLGHVPKSKHMIDEGQLTLFDGIGPEEPEPEPAPEHVDEAPDGETRDDPIRARNKPKNRSRKPDTSSLPRVEVVHELPEEERVCPKTGVQLVPVGEKVTEELDYVAAELRVVEHHQIIYGPPPEVAKERHIDPLEAALPARAVEGCPASAALIAQLLVQKYAYHLPLYRQEEIFRQAGMRMPRSTLCDWVMKAAFELAPIARAIENEIRAGPVLALDDTPIKCQAGKGHGNFQAYLWTFTNPDVPGIAFRFTEGRKTVDLTPLLKGVSAEVILGDGYAANRAAAREAGLEVEHAGCWAHVVRKFKDAASEAPAMVRLYRDDIRVLYEVEREADEAELSVEARQALREERSKPAVVRLMRRTLGWKRTFSLTGKMADAIKYLRNSRRALMTYLRDGRVPIDNNPCELSIRPVAVGRKNWLFAGSPRGGEAAATIYTLVETCKAVDVDVSEYLTDALSRLGTHPASRIDELTPARWKKLRSAPVSD